MVVLGATFSYERGTHVALGMQKEGTQPVTKRWMQDSKLSVETHELSARRLFFKWRVAAYAPTVGHT